MNKFRKCKACDLPSAPASFADVERSIFDNNMIKPENLISEELYLQRLKICLDCASLSDITCLECGCFVQLRAYQKNKSCPHKNGDRWMGEI